MTRYGWSLRWLIGGIYFLIISTTLGALALYLSHVIETDKLKSKHDALLTQLRLSADMIGRLARTDDEAQTIENRMWVSAYATGWYVKSVSLLTTNGQLITEKPLYSTPDHLAALPPEIKQAMSSTYGEGSNLRLDTNSGYRVMYLAKHVRFTTAESGWGKAAAQLTFTQSASSGDDEKPVTPAMTRHVSEAVLVIAAPTTDVDIAIGQANSAILLAFFCAMGVLSLIHLGVSSYMVRPLVNLSAVAERFAAGNFRERVRPAGAQEIASLGTSFNRMAEQLRLTITRLAEERAQAEAIFVSMADGVLVTDPKGVILLINRRAEEICGVDGAIVMGQTLTSALFHYELDDLLSKTLSSGLPLQHETTFKHPVSRVVEVHMAPVDVEGRRFGAVITLYDITPRRKLEQMRRDFVANVSHELRTPVTSIRAMAETLLNGGIAEEPEMANEFLQTIAGESERLTALLDDLLQLSRIESSQRGPNPAPLDLGALVHHVADRVIAPITAKGQQLVFEVPEQLMVKADRDSLMQVLVNLLDNARKYSPDRATITVHVDRDEDEVRVQVKDTGYGIPREDLTRIFERFYRVDKARSRAEGGTGLGLAIVKHLIEQQGGRIMVSSEVGVGSVFTVVLPLEEEHEQDSAEAGELLAEPRELDSRQGEAVG